MKRTPLKKMGKVGRANQQARDKIALIAEEKGLNYCELKFEKCQNWPLAPAHRHKRAWYKGDVDLLADFNQWVAACQYCHALIEIDPLLTEKVFNELRPKSLPAL